MLRQLRQFNDTYHTSTSRRVADAGKSFTRCFWAGAETAVLDDVWMDMHDDRAGVMHVYAPLTAAVPPGTSSLVRPVKVLDEYEADVPSEPSFLKPADVLQSILGWRSPRPAFDVNVVPFVMQYVAHATARNR
jgi:phage host-nuclease inhibitor protein Gam